MKGRREDPSLERRLLSARAWLRDHHAGVEPDDGFADRVAARLAPVEPTAVLGWAAVRVLPATVALALALLYIAAAVPQRQPSTMDTAPEDELSLLLDNQEASP